MRIRGLVAVAALGLIQLVSSPAKAEKWSLEQAAGIDQSVPHESHNSSTTIDRYLEKEDGSVYHYKLNIRGGGNLTDSNSDGEVDTVTSYFRIRGRLRRVKHDAEHYRKRGKEVLPYNQDNLTLFTMYEPEFDQAIADLSKEFFDLHERIALHMTREATEWSTDARTRAEPLLQEMYMEINEGREQASDLLVQYNEGVDLFLVERRVVEHLLSQLKTTGRIPNQEWEGIVSRTSGTEQYEGHATSTIYISGMPANDFVGIQDKEPRYQEFYELFSQGE